MRPEPLILYVVRDQGFPEGKRRPCGESSSMGAAQLGERAFSGRLRLRVAGESLPLRAASVNKKSPKSLIATGFS